MMTGMQAVENKIPTGRKVLHLRWVCHFPTGNVSPDMMCLLLLESEIRKYWNTFI